MTCVRYNGELYKYKLTMGDIEAYLSLKQQEARDLARIVGIPADIPISLPTNLLPLVEYRQMCAVCGLSDRYYEMEPQQILDAYEGYKRKMLDVGNLIIVAVRKAYDTNSEPFVYEPKHTREETFGAFEEELKHE